MTQLHRKVEEYYSYNEDSVLDTAIGVWNLKSPCLSSLLLVHHLQSMKPVWSIKNLKERCDSYWCAYNGSYSACFSVYFFKYYGSESHTSKCRSHLKLLPFTYCEMVLQPIDQMDYHSNGEYWLCSPDWRLLKSLFTTEACEIFRTWPSMFGWQFKNSLPNLLEWQSDCRRF